MQDLLGKTAVVTGAASGMGRAFANRFARAGMNVVMSDIEEPRLAEAVAEVGAHGTEVRGVITDVADAAAVEQLAAETFDAFGTAHVVCNNAGVAGGRGGEDLDLNQWKWIIDVNLWGVVHGHKVLPARASSSRAKATSSTRRRWPVTSPATAPTRRASGGWSASHSASTSSMRHPPDRASVCRVCAPDGSRPRSTSPIAISRSGPHPARCES